MLTEIYIEALLVDEKLADWVWEAWDAGLLRMKWRRGPQVDATRAVTEVLGYQAENRTHGQSKRR